MVPADGPALFEMFRDPQVLRHYDVDAYPDLQAAEGAVSRFSARFHGGEGIRWGFESRASGRLVGHGGFARLDAVARIGTLGYVLARPEWGQGLAREALRAIVDHGFRSLQLLRVEAEVVPENDRSLRVLRALGFAPAGTRLRPFKGGTRELGVHGLDALPHF